MISYLSGICAEVGADKAVIDVNGVGFEVGITSSCAEQMPGIGEPVLLYTYFSVREDGMSLYGFLSREELQVFKMLIGVSGVGPKGALGMLSALPVDDLRFAIVTGDAKALARAPGIGKKTAERLVLELRDKFSADELLSGGDARGAAALSEAATGEGGDEAVLALVALGYGHADASRAVRSAKKQLPEAEGADTEALLKAALRELV